MSQSIVASRPVSKKRSVHTPVKEPVPQDIKPAEKPIAVDEVIAAARAEQRNNSVYRALVESNERLIQQVIDLANLCKSSMAPGSGVDSDHTADHDVKAAAVGNDSCEESRPMLNHLGQLLNADGVTLGRSLRSHCGGPHGTPHYRKARDEMMQAIIRNYSEFDGSMSRDECAKYLDVGKSLISRYANHIRGLRAAAMTN